MKIKIHIEKDFSYAEFETDYNPETGEGLPSEEFIGRLFGRLPGKGKELAVTRAGAKKPEKKDPPATPAQRRLLENIGLWEEGLTRSEASTVLTNEGY